MGDRSAIEWTDATWNPVRGCSRVSAGCEHCYAERVAARFSGAGQPYAGLIHPSTRGWNGKITLVPELLDQPLRWRRARRIFVNSMSDLFHENVPDNFIAAVFGVMAAAQQHTFQVLTKRPERARLWFQWMQDQTTAKLHECLKGAIGYHHPRRPAINDGPWPLPNVWLGVSVEDQAAADARIPLLLQTPAAVRFLSCEPLLGSIDLTVDGLSCAECPRCSEGQCVEWDTGANSCRSCDGTGKSDDVMLDWVIAGGESGPGARPMHPDWVRTLRDQCAAAGVPFFFKQWGEWAPDEAFTHMPRADSAMHEWFDSKGLVMDHSWRYGKKATGHLLDGREHQSFPETRR